MKKDKQNDIILHLWDSYTGKRIFVDSEDQLPADKMGMIACINFPHNEKIIEEELNLAMQNIEIDKQPTLKDATLHGSKIFDLVIDDSKILKALKEYHLYKYNKIAEIYDKRIFTAYDMESDIVVSFNYFKRHLQSKINEGIEELISEAEFEIKNMKYSALNEDIIESSEIEEYIIKPARKRIHKRLNVKKPGGSKTTVDNDTLDLILLYFDKCNKNIKTLKKHFFKDKEIDMLKYKNATPSIQNHLDFIKKHIDENPSLITTRACLEIFDVYIDPQILYRKLLKRKKYQKQRKLDFEKMGFDEAKMNEALLNNYKPQ